MSALPLDELQSPADVAYVGLDRSLIERSDSAFPPPAQGGVENGETAVVKIPPPPSLKWYAESEDSIG